MWDNVSPRAQLSECVEWPADRDSESAVKVWGGMCQTPRVHGGGYIVYIDGARGPLTACVG